MANILTGIRILCGIMIFFFPAFSGWYYSLFLLGGLTDAVDGTVARRQGKVTDFGARFDTVADIVFAVAIMIKIACNVRIPTWLFVWAAIIAAVKASSLLTGILRHHRFITVHSTLNKVTGFILFITLLSAGFNGAWQAEAVILIIACLTASTDAVHEFICVLKGKEITS